MIRPQVTEPPSSLPSNMRQNYIIENNRSIIEIYSMVTRFLSNGENNYYFNAIDFYWNVNYMEHCNIEICVYSFLEDTQNKYIIEVQCMYGDRHAFRNFYERFCKTFEICQTASLS